MFVFPSRDAPTSATPERACVVSGEHDGRRRAKRDCEPPTVMKSTRCVLSKGRSALHKGVSTTIILRKRGTYQIDEWVIFKPREKVRKDAVDVRVHGGEADREELYGPRGERTATKIVEMRWK